MELNSLIQPHQLIVIQGCSGSSEVISTLIAESALRAPVHVLDGGNRFAAYQIMRLIRKRTIHMERAAERIHLQRAFTCYQMLSLLEETPSEKTPCILLDLLTTFYDENIPTYEARRVLENCLTHLERLALTRPVVLTLTHARHAERAEFTERILESTDHILRFEEPVSAVMQPTLF